MSASPTPGPEPALPRLLLVTDRRATAGRDLVTVVAAAARGGLRCLQVREKDLPDAPLADLAARLRAALPSDAVIVINDRPDVARALGSGLHLSAANIAIRARGLAPLGRSVHSLDEAVAARAAGADYLVLGTLFPTASKPGLPGAGLDLVRAVTRAVHLPVYGIGGIDAPRAGLVIAAGAYGVAVRGAVLQAPDPAAAARAILSAVERAVPR